MGRTLFVERFLVKPELSPVPESTYDEKRGYAVAANGVAVVALFSAGATQTVTEVRNESPDSDPEPDTGTFTFVQAEGPDVNWSLSSNETSTRVRSEEPDEPPPHAETQTTTKVRGEEPDQPWVTALEVFSTMTKTAVDYPRDQDSD